MERSRGRVLLYKTITVLEKIKMYQAFKILKLKLKKRRGIEQEALNITQLSLI